jgi:FAD:protein FMN transferase
VDADSPARATWSLPWGNGPAVRAARSGPEPSIGHLRTCRDIDPAVRSLPPHITMEGMTASSQPTRREFLQGRAVAEALTEARRVLEAEQAQVPELRAPRSSLVLTARRRAMACDFEVQFPTAGQEDALKCVLEGLDLIEALEEQMTVYRDDSEVLRINRLAADEPVPVEPRLFALFQLLEQIWHDTQGAIDITTGPLSEVWGFSKRAGRWPGDAELSAALSRVGMDQVVLDEATQTIHFLDSGVMINLNSVGKGYALDRMGELLSERGLEDFLLHGGRSSVLARGKQPGTDKAGWSIGLPHPIRPKERLAEFWLRGEALATSGSSTQYFEHKGRKYGHLLDPRTGRPAAGVFTATALAPTAAVADALSTAFYVMGPEQTERYCAEHPEIGAVLVCPAKGRKKGQVRLLHFGLDPDKWTQSSG